MRVRPQLGGTRLERIPCAGRLVEEEEEYRLVGKIPVRPAAPETLLEVGRHGKSKVDLFLSPIPGFNEVLPADGARKSGKFRRHAHILSCDQTTIAPGELTGSPYLKTKRAGRRSSCATLPA